MHKEAPSQPLPPMSTNPLPLLPPDTLAIILNFLSTSKSSLYSCALVNRMWCRLSIPLLWSNPFSLMLQSSPSDWCLIRRNSVLIIETYVACLSDEERQRLVDAGVIDGDGGVEHVGNSESAYGGKGMTGFRGNPLFDYTVYLK